MELTDAGNADRFAESRPDLRYVAEKSTWVLGRGGRWFVVEDEVVIRAMIETIRALREHAADEVVEAFAAASLNHERIVGAIELAKAHEDLLTDVRGLGGDVVGIEVEE